MECYRAGKKRQNTRDSIPTDREPMGRRSGGPLPLFGQWSAPGRSLQLRSAFRPQRKPFRLQSFTDKPQGWSIIITFHTWLCDIHVAAGEQRCTKTSAILVLVTKNFCCCDMGKTFCALWYDCLSIDSIGMNLYMQCHREVCCLAYKVYVF